MIFALKKLIGVERLYDEIGKDFKEHLSNFGHPLLGTGGIT